MPATKSTHFRAYALSVCVFATALGVGRLGAEEPKAPAPEQAPVSALPEVQKALAETESKLATALRSYSLLQRELEEARSQAAATGNAAESKLATLQSELTALRQQLESAKTEAQEKSGAVTALQESISQLRAEAVRQGADLALLREQNRQLHSSLAQLAEDNAQYRTRMALLAPGAQGSLQTPSRPGATTTPQAITLPPVLTAPKSVAPAPVAEPPPPPPPSEQRRHIIVEGDSLSKISKRYYGSPERWPEIFAANRDLLTNANRLPAGASLRIP